MSRDSFDTSSRAEFLQYYARQSAAEGTRAHFARLCDAILNTCPRLRDRSLRVCDVGGGAGALSRIWAERGHRVTCVDINEDLIRLGRERATEDGLDIEFRVDTATHLPAADGELDVCIAPELLEHVEDWEACLDEFSRVVRPDGGVVYISTTNKLCPKQVEFNLPLYSWYPSRLKRYFEHRVRTDKPQFANFATYPAVNWFTPFGLRRELRTRGFTRFFDSFDLAFARDPTGRRGQMLKAIRSCQAFRTLGYLVQPTTVLLAEKGTV